MNPLFIELFYELGFPFIQDELTSTEPAPNYEEYPHGIAELQKVLDFAKQDNYYPTFEDKVAYILCSIASSQYFPNGNKRLAVTALLLFLTINNVEIMVDSTGDLQEILSLVFPRYTWEENQKIGGAHALFLYNLAAVLGDRSKWETNDFGSVREQVAVIFKYIYRLEKR